jgi:hypothetical protein
MSFNTLVNVYAVFMLVQVLLDGIISIRSLIEKKTLPGLALHYSES